MWKPTVVDVLEHICIQSIEKNKIWQVFSDGPIVNFLFLRILDEHRHDSELNPLVDIGTCVLHTKHNLFKHGEKESNWNIKKLLNHMFKLLMKVHHVKQIMKGSLLY